jgi:hypothetical protein
VNYAFAKPLSQDDASRSVFKRNRTNIVHKPTRSIGHKANSLRHPVDADSSSSPPPPWKQINLARIGELLPDRAPRLTRGARPKEALIGVFIIALIGFVMHAALNAQLASLIAIGTVVLVVFVVWVCFSITKAKEQSAETKASTESELPTDADIPAIGSKHARLRLVGEPDAVRAVLARVNATAHMEPFITKPSGGVSIEAKEGKQRTFVDASMLAMPPWQRAIVVGIFVIAGGGITFLLYHFGMLNSSWIYVGSVVFGTIAGLASFFVPTYVRIVSQRVDVMTFVPPGLSLLRTGERAKERAHVHAFDLRTSKVWIDISKGAAFIEDTQRSHHQSIVIEMSPAMKIIDEETRGVWAALLSAALHNEPAPPLPQDRLLD